MPYLASRLLILGSLFRDIRIATAALLFLGQVIQAAWAPSQPHRHHWQRSFRCCILPPGPPQLAPSRSGAPPTVWRGRRGHRAPSTPLPRGFRRASCDKEHIVRRYLTRSSEMLVYQPTFIRRARAVASSTDGKGQSGRNSILVKISGTSVARTRVGHQGSDGYRLWT